MFRGEVGLKFIPDHLYRKLGVQGLGALKSASLYCHEAIGESTVMISGVRWD
jgi:hypothetical protein